MLSLFDKNQRWRKKALATTKDESFRQYLLNDFPKTSQTVSETEFLVLDFETTGLDSKKDHIISAGWVEISK
ncbi:MAG TPA: 3'-5' exonuclease, partial [Gammaproteobacteria bacterium]|nr:3'-5' exonuclease [Gammaproteobacteria bacterium]